MSEKNKAKLTPKQIRFVHEYQIDMNATQSAIRAGYSKKTARQQGHKLLTRADILEKIQEARKKVEESVEQDSERALLKAEEVERELDRIIRFNLKDFVNDNGEPKQIHELTKDQAACVRELGVLETQIGTHRTLKFYDKVKSIEVKMKRLGMLKEKVQVTEKRETYEEWRRRVGIDPPL
jgi:phage terminase small subunit